MAKKRTKKQVVAAFVERVSEIDFDRGFALVRIAPNRWRIVASKETTVGDVRGWCLRMTVQLWGKDADTRWEEVGPKEGEPEPIYKMTKDLTTLKFVDGQWVEVSRISDAPSTSAV